MYLPVWKSAPFIRILIPIIAGILLQWYLPLSAAFIKIAWSVSLFSLLILSFLPLSFRFFYQSLHGLFITTLIAFTGMLIIHQNYLPNQKQWFGHYYNDSSGVIVIVDEPISERSNTYKTTVAVKQLVGEGHTKAVNGKILFYISKDSLRPELNYGDKLFFSGHNPPGVPEKRRLDQD